MADASPIQTSFNGGIFSPLLDGHIDAPRRGTSYSDSTNLIALKQGPLVRRGGTIRVFEEKLLSDGRVKLIDFIFNDEQAYILAFSQQNLRVYRNGKIVFTVADNETITAITAASPPVVTVTTAYANGRRIEITGLTEAIELNDRNYTILNKTATTFELFEDDGTTAIAAPAVAETSSTGLAQAIFGLTLPYTTEASMFDSDGLFRLDIVQSNDVMYIAQPDFATRVLARTADDVWTIAKLRFDNGPFQTQNFSDTNFIVTNVSSKVWNVLTSVPNVVVTSDTLTSAAGGDANDLGTATETNRQVRILDLASSRKWRWGRITKYVDTTNFQITIDSGAKDIIAIASPGTTDWALGAYSDTTGYPSVITIHEGRLAPGATSDEPRRVDMSAIAGFNPTSTDFIPSDEDGVVRPDDAISVTIGGGSANPIMWIESILQGLAVGTIASEGIIRSSRNNESLTPTNASYTKSSTAGSASIQPIPIKNSLIHVQFIRRRLQELTFNFELDGFRSFDMTELAENLTRKGIVDIAYQQQPIETIWTLLDDGNLIGFTYERNADVVGWHRHILGGTDVDVNSIAVIPSEDLTRDELWLVVTRTITGLTTKTRTYIERMDRFYEDDIFQEHAYHQDCGVIYRTAEFIISAATKANPVVVTSAAHGRVNGDLIYIRDITGMTELNGNTYLAADITSTTAKLADPITSLGPKVSISGATKADPVVVTTSVNHGLTSSDKVLIRDVAGMVELNDTTFNITVVTSTTFSLQDVSTDVDVNGTGFTTYLSAGTVQVYSPDFVDGTAFTTYESGGTLQESVAIFRALDFLEGETVEVYVDGRVHADKVVVLGKVTLDDGLTGANVSIGLPHTWTFKSHPIEIGTIQGSTQGKLKHVYQVIFRLLSTLGFQYGPDLDGFIAPLDEEPFDYGTDINSLTPLFSGLLKVDWPGGWEQEGRITAKGSGPFPAQIQSIVPQIKVSDRVR